MRAHYATTGTTIGDGAVEVRVASPSGWATAALPLYASPAWGGGLVLSDYTDPFGITGDTEPQIEVRVRRDINPTGTAYVFAVDLIAEDVVP